MLAVDLRNAVEDPQASNFTCLLMRLILKADSENKAKLAEVYPVEVEMCRIFKTDCPYKDEKDALGYRFVDFEAIERQAMEACGVQS